MNEQTCKTIICPLTSSGKIQGFANGELSNVIICLAYVCRSPLNLKFIKLPVVVRDNTTFLQTKMGL